MIFAFFGVTCVGKTTIGEIIAESLGYEFYDLDAEIKLFYNDTLTNIYKDCMIKHDIDKKKAAVLQSILNKCSDNAIIAISPIYYTQMYKLMFTKKAVFSIVLEDTPENIADRMIYTDDNDVIIENQESDRKEVIRDIRYFISHYKNAYNKIQCHYQLNGKSAAEAAEGIIKEIIKPLVFSGASAAE
jgi:shikimate kinase